MNLDWDDKEIEALIKKVFDGDITEEDLPEKLYYDIAEVLKKGLYKGYGGSLKKFEVDTKDYDLLAELRENIYMFSAAKTYQQVRDMTDALTNDEGTVQSFKQFREAAGAIFDQYNENWLRAEYDTAIGQGMMGEKWNRIEEQKDVLPILKYSAVDDEVTCDICGPLDGMTAPVDDPVWDEFYPENHFRCRCTVEQIAEGESKNTPADEIEERTNGVRDKMDDEFLMNAGKDGVVFNKDHPYFSVAKGDSGLAKRNFDLPIPDEDE